MSHRGISVRIRAAVIGAGVCIVLLYVFLTVIMLEYIGYCTGKSDIMRLTMWLVLILGTALPCLAALYFGWRISGLVSADRTFSIGTARMLGRISTCAFTDAGYFVLGSIVMAVCGFQHPATAIISFAFIILSIAVGMAFAALARFIQKAADLQEESDYTV